MHETKKRTTNKKKGETEKNEIFNKKRINNYKFEGWKEKVDGSQEIL